MKDDKKLVWLVNGTPEEEEFVKKALGEEFSVSPVHSISLDVHRQRYVLQIVIILYYYKLYFLVDNRLFFLIQ